MGFRRTNCFQLFETCFPQQIQEGAGLAAGNDQPIDIVQLLGFFTSTTSAPSSSSRRRWASKSPCRARTPIFILI